MTRAALTSDLITRPRRACEPRRRNLVLTDESARHPFRSVLPPSIKRDLIPIPAESLWRLTVEDVRGVASTYVASTAAILAFIL
jgi:hypothetical protein